MEFIGGMSWAPSPTKRTVETPVPTNWEGISLPYILPLHYSLFTIHFTGCRGRHPLQKRTVGDACPYIFPFSSGVRIISLGITPHPSTALTPSPTGEGFDKKETTKSWFLLFLIFLCFATCCAVCFNDCIISNDFSKGVYIVMADICNNIIVNCICLAV